MRTAYNLNKIVRIRLIEPRESLWFTWKSERKHWLFGVIRKEGFYSPITDSYCGTEIDNHQVVDGKVIELPHVIVNYQGGIEQERYFDTLVEAQKWYEKLLSYL